MNVEQEIDNLKSLVAMLQQKLINDAVPIQMPVNIAPAPAQVLSSDSPSQFDQTVTWWTRKTGALQVTVTLGKVYFKGVAVGVTSFPANGVVNLTDNATKWAWLSISLITPSVTWITGTDDPGNGSDNIEIRRIFKAVTSNGIITELLICQDFHLPGNA